MLVIDENKNIQVSQYDTFSIRFKFKPEVRTFYIYAAAGQA